MIVKIQRPLFSNNVPDGMTTALVYDETRDFYKFLKITDEIEALLDDEDKVYVECTIHNGRPKFGAKVEPQDW